MNIRRKLKPYKLIFKGFIITKPYFLYDMCIKAKWLLSLSLAKTL